VTEHAAGETRLRRIHDRHPFDVAAVPLKFLWAPLSSVPLPLLDRQRGWIPPHNSHSRPRAALAFQNPAASLLPVTVCAVAIVFFSASQDIVFYAYRTDVAKPHERGMAAAANNLGYRASAWIAFALALVLADYFGWQVALLAVAAIMAMFAVATWFPSPETPMLHHGLRADRGHAAEGCSRRRGLFLVQSRCSRSAMIRRASPQS
jgi:MFS family permease